MKILQIKSSILGENSDSTKYTNKLVSKIKNNEDTIVVRDVALNPVTQLSGKYLGELANTDSSISK